MNAQTNSEKDQPLNNKNRDNDQNDFGLFDNFLRFRSSTASQQQSQRSQYDTYYNYHDKIYQDHWVFTIFDNRIKKLEDNIKQDRLMPVIDHQTHINQTSAGLLDQNFESKQKIVSIKQKNKRITLIKCRHQEKIRQIFLSMACLILICLCFVIVYVPYIQKSQIPHFETTDIVKVIKK